MTTAKHEVLRDELLGVTKELSIYHDAIVQSLSLLVALLFTTSTRTHKSAHTSFFKSPWNLAKVFHLQFTVQPNHLWHCGGRAGEGEVEVWQ